MAWIDIQAVFSPFASYGGTPDSIGSNASAVQSSLTYDITGAGLNNAPKQIWGNATTFGADMGVGDGTWTPFVDILITTAVTGGTSMNFQLQSAPDNGSNAAGTWSTDIESGAIAVANLGIGARIMLPFARRPPGAALPRFYRVQYTSVGNNTTGAASAGIVIGNITDTDIGQYPSNITFGTAG